MSQLFAFRRSLRFIALALCSASIFVFVSPASARPHHAGRHARAYHAGHYKHHAYRHHRHAHKTPRSERGAEQMQAGGFAEFNPSYTPMMAPAGFGPPSVADVRRRGTRRVHRAGSAPSRR